MLFTNKMSNMINNVESLVRGDGEGRGVGGGRGDVEIRSSTVTEGFKAGMFSSFLAVIGTVVTSLVALDVGYDIAGADIFKSSWTQICAKLGGIDNAVRTMVDAVAGINMNSVTQNFPVGALSTYPNGAGVRGVENVTFAVVGTTAAVSVRRSASNYCNVITTDKFVAIGQSFKEMMDSALREAISALSRRATVAGPLAQVAAFATTITPSGYYSRALELVPFLTSVIGDKYDDWKEGMPTIHYWVNVSEYPWLYNYLKVRPSEEYDREAVSKLRKKIAPGLWSEEDMNFARMFVTDHERKRVKVKDQEVDLLRLRFSLTDAAIRWCSKDGELNPEADDTNEILGLLLPGLLSVSSAAVKEIYDTCFPRSDMKEVCYLRDDQLSDSTSSSDWYIFPDSKMYWTWGYLLANLVFGVLRGCAGGVCRGRSFVHKWGLDATRLNIVIPGIECSRVNVDMGNIFLVPGYAYPAFTLFERIMVSAQRANRTPSVIIPNNFRFHDWVYGLDSLAKLGFTCATTMAGGLVNVFVPVLQVNVDSRDTRMHRLIDWKVGDFKTNWQVTRGYLTLKDSILGVYFGIDKDVLFYCWVSYGWASGFMIDKIMQHLGCVYHIDKISDRWDNWSATMWRRAKPARIFVPFAGVGDYEHTLAFFPRENSLDIKVGCNAWEIFYRGFGVKGISGMVNEWSRQVVFLDNIDIYSYFTQDGYSKGKYKELQKEAPVVQRYLVEGFYELGVQINFDYTNLEVQVGGSMCQEPCILPVIRNDVVLTWKKGRTEGMLALGASSTVPEGPAARSQKSGTAFLDF